MGGSSRGIYKSLNCGLGSFDKIKNVKKNIEIVLKKIHSKPKKIILLNQIHSNKFHYITKKNIYKKKFIGDAIITNQKNIPIAVLTADCVPILIYDRKKSMIAAVHAGWKGAFKGIVKKVIKFMIKKGCNKNSITVVIGPCIATKNYQVKKDFIDKFLTSDRKNKIFFVNIKNKTYFSLNKYIYYQLKKLDIRNIDIIDKDTFDKKNNFFSARRSIGHNENDYGRNISIIMIKD